MQLTAIPEIRNRVFRTPFCELVSTLEIVIIRDPTSRETFREYRIARLMCYVLLCR